MSGVQESARLYPIGESHLQILDIPIYASGFRPIVWMVGSPDLTVNISTIYQMARALEQQDCLCVV